MYTHTLAHTHTHTHINVYMYIYVTIYHSYIFISDDINELSQLNFVLKDWDKFSNDEIIGDATIPKSILHEVSMHVLIV